MYNIVNEGVLLLIWTLSAVSTDNGAVVPVEILLTNILSHLEHRINSRNTNSQLKDWENSCAHLKQKVSFRSGNEIINGVFKGLSSTGQAIVAINNEEVIFNSGEII